MDVENSIKGQQKVKIKLEELAFYYGDCKVLDGISMEFFENNVTAIIGPSGCGKSTLVKSINRISEITNDVRVDGKLLLDNKNIYDRDVDLADLRRRVGMVFQRPNPFPKSIYDNVAFGPRLCGKNNSKSLDEIVEYSLTRCALWNEAKDRLHQSAMGLSGGQQQRLCIARALAVDPEVLLMDEPCSALDPTATARIEELIEDLKRYYTIIIVTHNMQQAARVSNYTGFLLNGELIEYNITTEIFTNPDKKVTEDYITGRFG
ncbi:MAG: phosphate ABC transporter ATP-binding protein [Planctomycetes bacterium]|nr:phosphate ABC transporter ATP-binding protein [Planctomycetota bacterium]